MKALFDHAKNVYEENMGFNSHMTTLVYIWKNEIPKNHNHQ